MSRAGRVMRRAVGALAAVLAGLSVRGLAGALLLVLIVVAALCWILTATGRSERLAMLISACRGSTRPLPARALSASRGRRADRAADSSPAPSPPGDPAG